MQNIFQGLPLRLLPEEVHALWSAGLVDIMDETLSYREPTTTQRSMAGSIGSTTSMAPIIKTADGSSHKPSGPKGGGDSITLHTLSDCLPWYMPVLESEPEESSKAGKQHDRTANPRRILQYPANAWEWQQALIFKHLWATQKFFLVPGMKFGGDYLLYRSDPLVCHASLIAKVKDPDEQLSLTNLVSRARLASTVQKQYLICSLATTHKQDTANNDHNQQEGSPEMVGGPECVIQEPSANIVMFAVEWAGF
ncbi:tRNA-splicing endonuclease subunit [Mortierella polycephala]|uniref:tRNA-intron lyase n=1 Tax=Mortierella polycephala TaxID=41804 RepID=A0A9P6Q103_9FUNG|nr:tRNA-splicing endonuclease subunit [Mortierella polycephala]